MADRPLARLRVLVGVVVLGGIGCMVASLPAVLSSPAPETWRLAVCAAAFTVGDIALLHIRFGTHRHSFTWGEVSIVLGLVLLPLPWLAVLAPLAVAPAHLVARRGFMKVAFNTTSYATGVTLAALVIASTGPAIIGHLGEPLVWLRLFGGVAAYFLWNSVTVSAAVALSQELPFAAVLTKGLVLNLLVLVGNTATGIMVVAMASIQPSTLMVLPVVLSVLYLIYRSCLRAMQERETWEVLQATSRELLRTERHEMADVVMEHTGSLLNAEFVELLLVEPGPEPATATIYRRTANGERTRLEATTEQLANSYWGRAACEREPFEIRLGSAPPVQQRDLEHHGLATCLVAPLLVQDECLGALRVGYRGRVALDARDHRVFTTFANHVAGAAHNTRLFAEVRSQALHDPLTALPNRALLADRLTHAQARAGRSSCFVAVLFLDLDRFKVINDSLGHHVGDRLLVAVSERLVENLRPGDTAGRFGGDEFIVICEDVADDLEALQVAERLVASLERPFELLPGGEPVFLSASVGVALSRHADDDPASLLRDADAAMYRAKERGRSRCEVFDSEMRERAVARLEDESDLRRAIDRGEFRLDYQAFVDVATQTFVGAEALVRWDHPKRGEVAPGAFIPLAEETGLIRPLGVWVLQEACTQLAIWAKAEGWPADFTLAVNLSPLQLNDPNLLDDVTAAISSTGVDPGMLCLEITENALVDDMDGALETLQRLRAIGVRIGIDDFGTGYSSFSYLHRLPVDVLKIDRSFVSRLTREPRDRAVVAGMIELSHALGLRVVAEGVETPGQLAELCAMSCDLAQGFYLSAPAAPTALSREVRVQEVAAPHAS